MSIADKISGMQESAKTSSNAASSLGGALTAMDLSKVSDGFKVIPAETDCHFQIEKAESATASVSGNQMINLTLICVFPAEYAGTKVWDHLVLTPTSLWKFKSAAGACGLLSEDKSSFVGRSEKDFEGKIVGATVLEHEYNGRKSNKIKAAYFPVEADYAPSNVSTSKAPNFK